MMPDRRTAILAQYVRYGGKLYRLAVVACNGDDGWSVMPFNGETASTVFFNGLVVFVPESIPLPERIDPAGVEKLASELPEGPCLSKIPF